MKRILWVSVRVVVVVSACGGSDDRVQDADARANEFTVFGSDDCTVRSSSSWAWPAFGSERLRPFSGTT